MYSKDICAVFFTDDNYLLNTLVAIKSLINHCCDNNYYCIFLAIRNLDTDYVATKLNLIKQININFKIINITNLKFETELYNNTTPHVSDTSYDRLLITEIIPNNINKILYLDGDILINVDIAELYNFNLNDNYIAGVKDLFIQNQINTDENFQNYYKKFSDYKKSYVNSGVLVFNLEKLRAINFKKLSISKLKDIGKNILYHDQDIINFVTPSIEILPQEWNTQLHIKIYCYFDELDTLSKKEYNTALQENKITHFTGHLKPWNTPDIIFADKWWEYARQTPFYEEILFKNISEIIKKQIPTVKPCIDLLLLKIKYYKYKILSKILFGKLRKKYKHKKFMARFKIRNL